MSWERGQRQILAGLTLSLAAVLLAGCDKEGAYRLVFSHYLHVTDNGIECADCHGEMTEGRFTPAGHAACMVCHEDAIETKEIGDDTCGICHKVKDLKDLAQKVPPEPLAKSGGVFRHSDALAERCAECHAFIQDEKLSAVPEMSHGVKVAIRDRAHRWGLACEACHADMDPQTPPASHQQNWTRRHGTLGAQEDNACGVCHSETSCRDCHQVTQPVSHNNLWRLKTHGIQAGWDRERCLVCHQEDSCAACHSSTRPSSHNAAWRERHCAQCHAGSDTGAGCSLCHAADIEGHPSPHAAGWLDRHCDSCHAGTPEGDQCGICHVGVNVDAHPNPHSAGWQGQHCDNCHPGTPEGDQCGVCHAGVGLNSHPNPHGAGWQNQHCGQCHLGTQEGVQCAACHGGNPGGRHGNPHGAGWQNQHCDSCHLGTPEGGQCGVCHYGVNLNSHPNPHGAGWQSQHCNSCHPGTPDTEQCTVCHGNDLIGAHPNPHSANWEKQHCYSCHEGTPEADQCAGCHPGGNSVLVHQPFWPPVHDRFGAAGICTDCH